jgi:SSS family solute:Na+ symporter
VQTADILVLAVYLALLVGVGLFLARRATGGASEYFVASRSMPAWAVAISLLATVQSAATFLGAPQQGASADLRYLLLNAGVILAALIVATVFLPVYYRLNVQTPYELLEHRYGPGARRMASAWYLLGRLLASGARVYIGAVPFSLAVFGHVSPATVLLCVALFMTLGALLTLSGGARAAIWTDVLQVAVYLGAALAIGAVILSHLRGTPIQALSRALEGPPGQGLIFLGPVGDWLDWSRPFTPLTAITGWMLLNLAFFAMDQDLTQRLLACRSAREATRSLVLNTVVLTLPVVGGFVLLGLLLALHFREAGLTVPPGNELITLYALSHSPAGVAGLFLAGVLAAGPAGINSSLNAMAASAITDLYAPLQARAGRALSDRQLVVAGRVATVVIGALMAGVAGLCVWWHDTQQRSIIDFALGIMIYAYAGLIGAFLGAVLPGRRHPFSALVGMPVGLACAVALQWASIGGRPLATPWQLLIASSASLAVCMLWPARPATR